jgi:hypothetical protein
MVEGDPGAAVVGKKLAVTPDGSPLALRVTWPVKVGCGVTVTV